MVSLHPVARPEEYVFTCVTGANGLDIATAGLDVAAAIVEQEGVTVVLPREQADAAGLSYDFVAAWITLTADTALTDVGITASFAAALRDAGISCNVLAGVHHDHVLVPVDQKDAALAVLSAL